MKKLAMDISYVFRVDRMVLICDLVTRNCALIALSRISYLIFISRSFFRCYVVFLFDIRCSVKLFKIFDGIGVLIVYVTSDDGADKYVGRPHHVLTKHCEHRIVLILIYEL
jgi:hypothetical protein